MSKGALNDGAAYPPPPKKNRNLKADFVQTVTFTPQLK